MAPTAVSSDFLDNNSLTNEIFSILENKFLFGNTTTTTTTNKPPSAAGKVRILTIDANDSLFAATCLIHLQSLLRTKSGNPNAQISDFFDVVAGSGDGGLLAALLTTPPLFSAEESLNFIKNRTTSTNKFTLFKNSTTKKALNKVFANLSLKDTVKPVLIPCYDLKTGAPFLFSRADALEMDGCDFKMADACKATSAAGRAVEIKSTDGRTKIVAVGGAVSMTNPTAAAITHVLNNKQEFPLCNGVEDLLVLSLGNNDNYVSKSLVGIAADGAADMVDQAVSMAFGEWRTNNYFRIQGNGIKKGNSVDESIFGRKSVESVLFQGKKLGNKTNMEKLEILGGELIKEQERRRNGSVLPTVVLKHNYNSPARSSSATTSSSISSY